MAVNVKCDGFTCEITLNHTGTPPGKLADVTLLFDEGPLAGLCLLGVSVWESREQRSRLNVTMPSRQFVAQGQKRSFSLVRVPGDAPDDPAAKREYYAPLDRLRHRILDAYHSVVDGTDRAIAADTPEDAPYVDDIPF